MNTRTRLSAWLLRLLFAALLLFGSEILLWTGLEPLSWLQHSIGYVALAALVFDIALRYRIRDLYDVMVVLAIYGVLAALLVTPEFSYAKFPVSLLTRVLGGQSLIALEMFGLLTVLMLGDNPRYRRLLMLVAAWLGFYWGVWIRWNPELSGLFEAQPLMTMFGYAALMFALPMVLWMLVRRSSKNLSAQDLLLAPVEWFFLALVLIGLFIIQALQEQITISVALASAGIIIVCWSILWFKRDDKGETLLDNYLPMTPLPTLWLVLAMLLFVIMAVFSYHLPLVGINDYNQLWLMEMGFAVVGTLWLPIVAAVIATRGVDHLMRTNKISL